MNDLSILPAEDTAEMLFYGLRTECGENYQFVPLMNITEVEWNAVVSWAQFNLDLLTRRVNGEQV